MDKEERRIKLPSWEEALKALEGSNVAPAVLPDEPQLSPETEAANRQENEGGQPFELPSAEDALKEHEPSERAAEPDTAEEQRENGETVSVGNEDERGAERASDELGGEENAVERRVKLPSWEEALKELEQPEQPEQPMEEPARYKKDEENDTDADRKCDDTEPEDVYILPDRYIFDEETGKVYEVVEKAPRTKEYYAKLIYRLLLIAAAVIALICGRKKFFHAEPDAEMPVISASEDMASQTSSATAEQPSESREKQEQEAQYVPADIVIDGKTRATLASAEAAYALLDEVTAYYSGMVEKEGERENTFEKETVVVPRPGAGQDELQSYDEVYALFISKDTPLRVRTTITNSRTEALDFDTDTDDDDTLLEDTRIVVTQGRTGSETIIESDVYINGDRSSTRSSKETQTIAPQDRLIRKGKEKLDLEEDSPGRHEGEKGRDADGMEFGYPVDGRITGNYGQIKGVLHLGLDFAPESEKVFASEAGTVVSAMERGGYGQMVEIDHGSGFVTRYAMLSSISVSLGDTVKKGQAIGFAGETLHFELRIDGEAYNPRYYISD